jgi:dienelactone hydrolase
MIETQVVSEERIEACAIEVDGVTLRGDLAVPPDARALVILVNGSGTSRVNLRNRAAARMLRESRVGTLLFDLLTPREEASGAAERAIRFDVNLLAARLEAVTMWATRSPSTSMLPVGYLGTDTGAAVALTAAAALPCVVRAVVSRGGRPDLAQDALVSVCAPTLLIVGSRDARVLELNCDAMARLRCRHALRVVPGATHLFEEPGKLVEATALARDWFSEHLTAERPPAAPPW